MSIHLHCNESRNTGKQQDCQQTVYQVQAWSSRLWIWQHNYYFLQPTQPLNVIITLRVTEQTEMHMATLAWLGSGDSSVVWVPGLWLKSRGSESLLERQENLLESKCFGICSTPRITAVVQKRSWSFCQKHRWQVTAKHACTLHMWLWMKWNGAWLYGEHRTHRDGSSFRWHQPCQCCQ